MTDYQRLLKTATDGQIEFILIGGLAGIAHGSSRFTQDVDLLYRRTSENISRVAATFAPLSPYLRGAPPGLPFQFDTETLQQGLNFTLSTDAGAIDLLGEIPGGNYDTLLPHTQMIVIFDVEVRCLDLETLIRVKRAAGRPKDFEAIAELEQIAAELRSDGQET